MNFGRASLCGLSVNPQQILAPSQSALHTSSATQPMSQLATDTLPPSQRRNPRRTSGNALQKPPTLVRQEDRKASFVDGLVDSATQMVEVIWPLSVAPCRPQAGGVLSLRRYIEETLRRSRTSYSTLQVALYYLVLIMPCVPKSDFTMQQSVDSASVRALQCGRRMFLAALILASKYLQDRNYSAKAWSKMSGLKVAEINLNERAFLEAVNWKLHIPDHVFKRWTDVVLRYTPSQFPPPAGQSFSSSEQKTCWKTIIPLLTADLEQVAPVVTETAPCVQPASPVESYSSLPSFLEPQPEVRPPTPTLNVGYLPTPRLTPPIINTPAVSVASIESFRSVGKLSRRSSFAASEVSTVLSPMSMLSDVSRLSPASSVSSASSSSFGQKILSRSAPVESNITSMDVKTQFTAYDAQPQASRAVKRSRTDSPDSEEEERSMLQERVFSLLAKQGSKDMPIVLVDEDCASSSVAADVAKEQAFRCVYNTHVAFEGDNKRRRTCYDEKSLAEPTVVAAY